MASPNSKKDIVAGCTSRLVSHLHFDWYSRATPRSEGSFLNARTPPSRVTTILESSTQETFAVPLSIMKALPDSFGNTSPRFKIVPRVLKPVVAPQFRENRTIFFLPSGDTTFAIGSLAHSSPEQPREKSARQIVKSRIISWLTPKSTHRH